MFSTFDVRVKREGWRAYSSNLFTTTLQRAYAINRTSPYLYSKTQTKFMLFSYETIDRFPTSSEPLTSVARFTSEKNARNPTKVDKHTNFVRAFFMQIIAIFGFKFALIWKLPSTQETQPKMVKEAWNCDRKVQRTIYIHFVALLCNYLRFCQNIEHVSLN